jgi:hypothetical protein
MGYIKIEASSTEPRTWNVYIKVNDTTENRLEASSIEVISCISKYLEIAEHLQNLWEAFQHDSTKTTLAS